MTDIQHELVLSQSEIEMIIRGLNLEIAENRGAFPTYSYDAEVLRDKLEKVYWRL